MAIFRAADGNKKPYNQPNIKQVCIGLISNLDL